MIQHYRYIMTLVYIYAHLSILHRSKQRGMNPKNRFKIDKDTGETVPILNDVMVTLVGTILTGIKTKDYYVNNDESVKFKAKWSKVDDKYMFEGEKI